MSNHGMRFQRGLNPVAASATTGSRTRITTSTTANTTTSTTTEGKFRRIFNLPPFVPADPFDLEKLGVKGGPMDGGSTPNPSTTIPHGFIFLGQFIDHDITLDATSDLDATNDPLAIENFRTPALDLDCIYGSGPEVSAHLYDRHGEKILTGKDGTAFSGQPLVFQNSDLTRNAAGIAIIGDPRNDENRIISQLQLAFIRFHNRVMDMVLNNVNNINDHRDAALGDDDDFKFAQRIVRWHYQWIVTHEFLPLMCGQTMVDDILNNGRQHYDPTDQYRTFIPIEFAVAAYRFGHSMVRQMVQTKVNDPNGEFLFGPQLGRGFTALNSNSGIVEWPALFNINSTAQTADKLDTQLASLLLELPFIPADQERSLAIRNLKRGVSFDLPSGEDVATAMGAPMVDPAVIFNRSNGIFGTSSPNQGKTPLWYYILLEGETMAANGPGEGLGPVGGRIVAETLIGIQQKDTLAYLNVDPAWSPFLKGNSGFTMADLLTL